MIAWLVIMALAVGVCLWLMQKKAGTTTITADGSGKGRTLADKLHGRGTYPLNLVGESFYQKALEEICNGKKEESEHFETSACVIPESNNPKDRNAVRVDIDGMTVGYLDREAAKRYRKLLGPSKLPECPALITGGWKRRKSEGSYGVKLDLNLCP